MTNISKNEAIAGNSLLRQPIRPIYFDMPVFSAMYFRNECFAFMGWQEWGEPIDSPVDRIPVIAMEFLQKILIDHLDTDYPLERVDINDIRRKAIKLENTINSLENELVPDFIMESHRAIKELRALKNGGILKRPSKASAAQSLISKLKTVEGLEKWQIIDCLMVFEYECKLQKNKNLQIDILDCKKQAELHFYNYKPKEKNK